MIHSSLLNKYSGGMPLKNYNMIYKDKLMLVKFTDEDGKDFPIWIQNEKCKSKNVTIGEVYECSVIGDMVLISNNDIGKSSSGFNIKDFKPLSEIRNDTLDKIL